MSVTPIVPNPLTPFEERDVVRAAIEIPNAAGGLREAMHFEPREFHHGDEVCVVLRCSVRKVRFDPADKGDEQDGPLARVHVFDAREATFIEAKVVEEALVEQRERLARARENEKGVQRLPTADELSRAHFTGEHAKGLVDGCPDCDEERELAAEGD